MSVAIFRTDGDMSDKNSKLIFAKNVSGEEFYQRVWTKAIADMNVKLFKDGSKFEVSDLEQVMSELKSLLLWAEANLSGGELSI